MLIAGWNVDGLKPDRLAAAATLFDGFGLTAAVFVETWMPSEQDLPARMSEFKFLSTKAVRGGRAGRYSGVITLMVRASVPARELAREPRAASPHWALWRVADDVVIAGVYLQPAVSLKLPQYRCVLAGLGNAIEQHAASADRLIVIGDFNAHLGSLTGDQACPRRQPVLDFLARCSLDLLNQDLSGDPSRWTYEAYNRGRSVVDLVMTRGVRVARGSRASSRAGAAARTIKVIPPLYRPALPPRTAFVLNDLKPSIRAGGACSFGSHVSTNTAAVGPCSSNSVAAASSRSGLRVETVDVHPAINIAR
ncbi:Reverse transcriptase domain-containing protein [Plasmodiophora brassicae]